MRIQRNGTRKWLHLSESEIKISQASGENVNEMEIDGRLILIFNFLRTSAGHPMRINSCGRTKKYNATLDGSATNSQHLILPDRPVRAMDLALIDAPVRLLKETVNDKIKMLRLMGVRGIGFYDTFVHVDTRPENTIVTWNDVPAEWATRWKSLTGSPLDIFK